MPDTADSTWGEWDARHRDDPYPLFARRASQSRCTSAAGRWARRLAGIGHDAARQALKDTRLSKDMVAALDQDPDVADAGLPGPDFARHMLAVDGEDHTRLAPPGVAGVRTFADRGTRARRSNASPMLCSTNSKRPDPTPLSTSIEGFAHPLPFRVICELLGVPGRGPGSAPPVVPDPVPAMERLPAARSRRRVGSIVATSSELGRRPPRAPSR